MVTSESRLAYADCYKVMEQAISDQYPKGIRIKCASYEDAMHFRLRLHKARKIDRKDNLEIYQLGDTMHGKSVYDSLIMRIRMSADDTAWLRLERVEAMEFEIESLEEDRVETRPLPPPQPMVVGNTVVIPIRSKMLRRM